MPIRREALLWLEAAREDLEDSALFLERGKWFRAAFFAQQAAEKALKALYIVELHANPPRTHILSDLYRGLAERGVRAPEDIEERLYSLSKYYTVTRYPDAANGPPREAVDREEAMKAYEVARRLVDYAWRRAEKDP